MPFFSFVKDVGIVTVRNRHIDHLYIDGRYQCRGFGTRLHGHVLAITGSGAYIDVPALNKDLLHICIRSGLAKTGENGHTVRMTKL